MKFSAKGISWLVNLSLGLALTVILLGAYTRLMEAGLGCPDWPGCYGQWIAPSTPTEISAANAAYPAMPVNIQKARTEMTHRYFAESLGALIVLLAIAAYRFRRSHRLPLVLSTSLVALVIFQGLLGMWTVTKGLLPIAVLGHLLGGFSTLALLWLCWLYLNRERFPAFQFPTPTKALALITLGVLILQIFLGGWTSANYAALICLDFPTCQGQWWPATDFAQAFHFAGHIEPNQPLSYMDATSRITLQMVHRLGAGLVLIAGTLLAWRLWSQAKQTLHPLMLRSASLWLQSLLLLQIGLGITNVLHFLPLPIAVAHNGVAALLLLTLVSLNFMILSGSSKRVQHL